MPIRSGSIVKLQEKTSAINTRNVKLKKGAET